MKVNTHMHNFKEETYPKFHALLIRNSLKSQAIILVLECDPSLVFRPHLEFHNSK
jgi:hypothetical protein